MANQPIRTIIPTRIAQRSTPRITFTILDELGVGIPAASLSALTLTLYKAGDLTSILNGRNKQNVLNQNGVTVDGAGQGVWAHSSLDNEVFGTDHEEPHIALFEWTWASGAKVGKHELLLYVVNLTGVP